MVVGLVEILSTIIFNGLIACNKTLDYRASKVYGVQIVV